MELLGHFHLIESEHGRYINGNDKRWCCSFGVCKYMSPTFVINVWRQSNFIISSENISSWFPKNNIVSCSYFAGAVATFASIVILALPLPRTGQNVTLSSKEQQSELPRLKANSSSFINQRNSIPKLTVNGHASNDFDEQSIKYDVQNANSCNNSLRITNGSAIDHSSGGVWRKKNHVLFLHL